MATGVLFFRPKMSSVEGDYTPGGIQGVGLIVGRIHEFLCSSDDRIHCYLPIMISV